MRSYPGRHVDFVGFHGQTIAHGPSASPPFTYQMGDAKLLSEILGGVPVVHDFRTRDVACGGEGAPLAPAYHVARLQLSAKLGALQQHALPFAILNIGGVSNVTVVYDRSDFAFTSSNVVAFDTGPGNALLDDFMMERTGHAIDRDGEHAARGKPNVSRVRAALLEMEDFLRQPPPKSLDRNRWHGLLHSCTSGMAVDDGAATLTLLTASAIEASTRVLRRGRPKSWFVTGGGRQNPVMMRMLRMLLKDAKVDPVEKLGWDGDALEAEAFAYLAGRAWIGIPTSLPSTTGVFQPCCGGKIA